MKISRFLVPILLLAPSLTFAASKEMIELQRDVAQLQDALRLLQQSFDTKTAQIEVLARQAAEGTGRATGAVSELQRSIQSNSTDLGKQVLQPIAAMNNRIDGISQDMQSLQTSVSEQNAKMSRIQQQLVDLMNAIKTMQAPAAPPPTSTDGTGAAMPPSGGALPGSASAAPPISSLQLWANAKRDNEGGNTDLALAEYSDYVKYYRDTDLAPTAQFNVGQIHFFAKKYDLAVQDFDQVLEAWPINPKTAEAHYMKGRALTNLGQTIEAKKEFRVCITQFGSSTVAPKCRESLAITAPPVATKRKKE